MCRLVVSAIWPWQPIPNLWTVVHVRASFYLRDSSWKQGIVIISGTLDGSGALLTSLSVCFSIRGPRKRSTPKSSRSNSLPTAWIVSSPRLRPQPTMPCGLNWTCWRPTTSACAAGWMGNVKRWRYKLHLQFLSSFSSLNWMILTCGWRQRCVCRPGVKKHPYMCQGSGSGAHITSALQGMLCGQMSVFRQCERQYIIDEPRWGEVSHAASFQALVLHFRC